MRTLFKPAGIPTLRPHADPLGDCVVQRLLREEPHRADLDWPAGFEGGIAHRLDVSTSGAIVAADTVAELARIREAFASGALRKTYRFRSRKKVPWTENSCELAIAHDRRRKGRMVVQRGSNTPHRGKWWSASTTFTQLEGSLWQAVITTGVMHQIRVHAAFLGLSLAGDRRYGGGDPLPEAPEGTDFLLHHIGLVGPQITTDPVLLPSWAETAR